jgi:alcohol dehydrogenase
MDRVIAHELEIYGSHGIQAFRYNAVFDMIAAGKLQPEALIGKTISLEDALLELPQMDQFHQYRCNRHRPLLAVSTL